MVNLINVLIWKETQHGHYSVRNAYRLLLEDENNECGSNPLRNNHCGKKLERLYIFLGNEWWKLRYEWWRSLNQKQPKYSQKIQALPLASLSWVLGSLPTMENVCRRGVITSGSYDLCKMELEDGVHALWSCLMLGLAIFRDIGAAGIGVVICDCLGQIIPYWCLVSKAEPFIQ